MVKKDLPSCSDCCQLWGGWIVVIEGEISRRRAVDFHKVRISPSLLEVGDVKLVLPSGNVTMRTGTFGRGRLVADPSLSKHLAKPFTISIAPGTTGYVMDYEDVKNLLPIDMRREIEKSILNDEDDQSLGSIWVERERAKQWEVYRGKCGKEARKYVKRNKLGSDDMSAFRSVKMPKALKSLESPRRKYVHLSARLFNETGRN
jgi:hypothetical protein